jgi:hypothetical protein
MVVLDLKSAILIEVSACPLGDRAVLFHLASVLLEALGGNCSILEYMSSPLVYCQVRVAQSLVFGVVICKMIVCFKVVRVFNSENNSYLKTSVRWTLEYR